MPLDYPRFDPPAFEPVPATADFAERNLGRIAGADARLVRAAVGDTAGSATIHLYSSSGNNSLHERTLPPGHPLQRTGEIEVSVVRLDDLVGGDGFPAPALIKIDVEGAEWDSLLSSPEEVLAQIDQIAVEFHGIEDEKSLALVRRLKQSFEVAHIHFNNASCTSGTEPFPSWAYEVLFVSKRLAVLDSSRQAGGRHPLDSPNVPLMLDCQP